nr:ribonuclease H-like domain-containing protein [Tanacetum cinerariifolium]
GDDRAPGSNGFTAAFFKKACDMVRGDITCAVRDFFSNGKLLKELNHTIFSLIPKVTTCAHINDYQPISCCNVLYKCISKIIANTVKEGLGDIANAPTSMGFDMSKVECYNCHRKGHFARECRSSKDTRSMMVWATMTGVFKQMRNLPTMLLWPSLLQVLLLIMRDNALVVLRQNLEKAEQERDDLKLKLEKFQTSSKNLSDLLASQTNAKTGSGYNSQVFTRAMFDCNDYSTSESDESLPPSPIYDRYQSSNGYHAVHPPYTGTFMPSKPNLVFHNAPNDFETVHTAFNVELSLTKPDNDLSHTHRPSAPIIEDWISDSEDDSETKPSQNVPRFVKPNKQVKSPRPSVKHVETSIPTANPKIAIPKPTNNSTRMNRKACFVYNSLDHLIKDCDYHEIKLAQTTARNHVQRGNHKHYASMPLPDPQRHVVSTAVVPKSKLVPINAARPITVAVPKINVTRPSQDKPIVTKPNSPPRWHINHSLSPKASNFPPKVTAVQGNPQHALKDKGVINSGCLRHMTGNMSYLSNFEELNGGYVAFGGNPKGGKIFGKGKIKTGKLDFDDVYFIKELKFNLFSVSQMCNKKNSALFTDTECLVLSLEFKLPYKNQVLLRVPRENNMYNVNLKNIVPSGGLTCLFANATLDESNLWHRRLGHINFKTINKLAKGNLVRGLPSKVFENDYTCVACKKGKQHRASCKTKPVEKAGEEIVQQYVLFPVWFFGFTNPHNIDGDVTFDEKEPEFEGRKPESEVNVSPSSSAQSKKHDDKTKREAKGKSPVESLTGYRNLSAYVAGPSNAAVSPTHGKSSYVDSSQLINDPNMPELEDITYYDDEENVGAEADFNNLETSITVSHIPTTRVHKNHPVTQIIGDLSSATQTRSMTRVAKDQGGPSLINNDDFHTYMFASFLSQEEPKRKVWVLVDLPHGKRAIDGKSASTPIDTKKTLLKDPDGEDVDVHTYRLMIGSLMYLTSSRPDIMFAGIEYLPNEEIFAELARMGYEKPSTKLTIYKAFFSSRKFNFSKYIFDSLVRNVDSSTKFYMFWRRSIDIPASCEDGGGDGIDGSSTAVGTTSAALTSPSAATPAVDIPSSCTSSAPSPTGCSTIIPSKSGVSTPENPLPTLLMFANTFGVRAEEEYFVVWEERSPTWALIISYRKHGYM